MSLGEIIEFTKKLIYSDRMSDKVTVLTLSVLTLFLAIFFTIHLAKDLRSYYRSSSRQSLPKTLYLIFKHIIEDVAGTPCITHII